MYTLIIAFMITAGWSANTLRKTPQAKRDYSFHLLFQGFALVFGILAAMLVYAVAEKERAEISRVELSSIQTNNSTEGAFVFASGTFGTQRLLQMRVLNSDGSSSSMQIIDDNFVSIKEDQELVSRGYLIKTGSIVKNSFLRNWVYPLAFQSIRVEIHVPIHTVRNSFSVN